MAGMVMAGGMAHDITVSRFIFRMGMAGTPDRVRASYRMN